MPTLSELTLGIFADDPYPALDVPLEVLDHPHPRARIRDWVVKRLRAAALLPEKISVNRATPAALSGAPVVLVYLLREDEPERFTEAPLTYARPFDLALHVVIADYGLPEGSSLDDVMDAFAEVFEAVLLCDVDSYGRYFGGLAAECELGEAELQTEADGERVFMHGRIVFQITYQRTVGRPAGNAFRHVFAEWDLAPVDGRIDATDVILLPTIGTLAGVLQVEGDWSGSIENP